ncbi:acetyltransferase, partial [Colletotrichum musicola]
MVSFKNVALLSFATSALACVDFTATLNNFQFASIRLVDNGQEICTYNGYGDNNGY